MKKTMSRRQMLKVMAMGAAGITLAACTPATATQAPTQAVRIRYPPQQWRQQPPLPQYPRPPLFQYLRPPPG